MNGKQVAGVAAGAALIEAGLIAGFGNEKFTRYALQRVQGRSDLTRRLLAALIAPTWAVRPHGQATAWTAALIGNVLLVVLVAFFASLLARGKHDERGSGGIFFGVWGSIMLAAAAAFFVRILISPAVYVGLDSGSRVSGLSTSHGSQRISEALGVAVNAGALHGLLLGWLPAVAALIISLSVRSAQPYAASYSGYGQGYGAAPPGSYAEPRRGGYSEPRGQPTHGSPGEATAPLPQYRQDRDDA